MKKISSYLIPRFEAFIRDSPLEQPQNEKPIQIRYFNDLVSLFLKTFSRFYSQDTLSDKDKENLKRYLDKMIEAKDSISGNMSL